MLDDFRARMEKVRQSGAEASAKSKADQEKAKEGQVQVQQAGAEFAQQLRDQVLLPRLRTVADVLGHSAQEAKDGTGCSCYTNSTARIMTHVGMVIPYFGIKIDIKNYGTSVSVHVQTFSDGLGGEKGIEYGSVRWKVADGIDHCDSKEVLDSLLAKCLEDFGGLEFPPIRPAGC